MNEGLLVLLGAIIGGAGSLLGTYLTLRHSKKIELKKLYLSFLIEKKITLEGLINNCSSLVYTGNMENDEVTVYAEFEIISEFVYQKSHYFTESKEFQKLQKNLFLISNGEFISSIERLSEENTFNEKARTFFQVELESVMKSIVKNIEY